MCSLLDLVWWERALVMFAGVFLIIGAMTFLGGMLAWAIKGITGQNRKVNLEVVNVPTEPYRWRATYEGPRFGDPDGYGHTMTDAMARLRENSK